MTDTNTQAAAPASDSKAPKAPKTTAEGMASRTIFANSTLATNFLMACGEKFADFNEDDQTIIIPFTDESGLDSEKFDAPGYEVMVATLKNRGEANLKAIVVTPIPTLELLLESEGGKDFLREITRKELNHRAVRQLRVAENPATVADQIPYSVDSFVSSSRGDAGIVESFNELYKHLNETLSKASPAWKRRKLTKSELRAAFESKAFALDAFPELEEAGQNGSLFVMALKLAVMTAEKKGLDATIFNRWMDSRDAATFEPTEDEDDALDFDSLAEAMLTDKSEPAPAETTDAGTESQEA